MKILKLFALFSTMTFSVCCMENKDEKKEDNIIDYEELQQTIEKAKRGKLDLNSYFKLLRKDKKKLEKYILTTLMNFEGNLDGAFVNALCIDKQIDAAIYFLNAGADKTLLDLNFVDFVTSYFDKIYATGDMRLATIDVLKGILVISLPDCNKYSQMRADVGKLLKAGANLNIHVTDTNSSKMTTPLIRAVKNADLAFVKMVLPYLSRDAVQYSDYNKMNAIAHSDSILNNLYGGEDLLEADSLGAEALASVGAKAERLFPSKYSIETQRNAIKQMIEIRESINERLQNLNDK